MLEVEVPHPPRVFLSYSHDSAAHGELVLALADQLRADGIDALVDQYEVAPPQGWPRWMDHHLRESDFVLVICTETYLRRARGEEDPGHGKRCELGVASDLSETLRGRNPQRPLYPGAA